MFLDTSPGHFINSAPLLHRTYCLITNNGRLKDPASSQSWGRPLTAGCQYSTAGCQYSTAWRPHLVKGLLRRYVGDNYCQMRLPVCLGKLTGYEYVQSEGYVSVMGNP